MMSGNNSSVEMFSLGPFSVHMEDSEIRVCHRQDPERVLWSTQPGVPLVGACRGEAKVEESRGFFTIDDRRGAPVWGGGPDTVTRRDDGLALSGALGAEGRWELAFEPIDDVQLGLRLSTDRPEFNRLSLTTAQARDNRIFGLGEQFTHLNMKGRRVPILSQEPGIGRGVQPLTWLMNTGFGAGGDWHTTNAPAPWYITGDLQGFCLENHEHSTFDFSEADRATVSVFSTTLVGRIFFGRSPLDLLEAYTRFSGRMRALPAWMERGAVIGMQGGTEAVRNMSDRLASVQAPVAAYWLQDWVGARKTSIGWQLWWNWELDRERYPQWEELVATLRDRGARVMTYLNPFLVDAGDKGTHRRNLYAEAKEAGFLIRRDGEPYEILNTSFSAALIDLSNPAACAWIKDVIRTELIGAGASGWMADFGEALPFDAELHDGVDAARFHNAYPEVWARVNREAIEEAGLGDEAVFFMRAGFTRSPRHCTLFWMGDQLTSWTREDGIKSTVVALLSSGMSGFSLNHSDIGGYTATTVPSIPFRIPGIGFTRGRELLHRWIELNAFTAVYRTHEGNQPGRHVQIDEDEGTLAHFARFARVFAALGPYRQGLGRAAAEKGHPVVRHPWLHHPEDPEVQSLDQQFMLGPDIMVAPVLDPGRQRVRLYLPAGDWRHLWTGRRCDPAEGSWFSVAAPPGRPAVFCRAESAVHAEVTQRLSASGDLDVTIDDLIRPAPR